VTKKGSGWGVTWSADGTGQSVSIDIQNGTGLMSRLDLAASIDEYLPVVMAQAYSDILSEDYRRYELARGCLRELDVAEAR
jgi:hypothetical protein